MQVEPSGGSQVSGGVIQPSPHTGVVQSLSSHGVQPDGGQQPSPFWQFGVLLQPVASIHVSLVQTIPSSQCWTAAAVQVPVWHVLWFQSRPLHEGVPHAVPFGTLVLLQPVASVHASVVHVICIVTVLDGRRRCRHPFGTSMGPIRPLHEDPQWCRPVHWCYCSRWRRCTHRWCTHLYRRSWTAAAVQVPVWHVLWFQSRPLHEGVPHAVPFVTLVLLQPVAAVQVSVVQRICIVTVLDGAGGAGTRSGTCYGFQSRPLHEGVPHAVPLVTLVWPQPVAAMHVSLVHHLYRRSLDGRGCRYPSGTCYGSN